MSEIDTAPALPSEDEIARLVDRFYAKARRDAALGPIFENAIGENWDRHLATMRDFWSSVMLTTGRYKGNPMAKHMRHPIAPEHFARWLELWGETTEELFGEALAARFREKAARIAESLQLGLFYRPGSLPIRPPTPRPAE
jgi:hemoglobin